GAAAPIHENCAYLISDISYDIREIEPWRAKFKIGRAIYLVAEPGAKSKTRPQGPGSQTATLRARLFGLGRLGRCLGGFLFRQLPGESFGSRDLFGLACGARLMGG